jgi:broad specificity phosphatase PhoE
MEIDLGAWQGQNEFEIKERYPGKFDACWNRPASYESVWGEIFLDVANRVGAF